MKVWHLTTGEITEPAPRRKGKQTTFAVSASTATPQMLQRLVGVECEQDKSGLYVGGMKVADRTKTGLNMIDGWFSIVDQWWKDKAKEFRERKPTL